MTHFQVGDKVKFNKKGHKHFLYYRDEKYIDEKFIISEIDANGYAHKWCGASYIGFPEWYDVCLSFKGNKAWFYTYLDHLELIDDSKQLRLPFK